MVAEKRRRLGERDDEQERGLCEDVKLPLVRRAKPDGRHDDDSARGGCYPFDSQHRQQEPPPGMDNDALHRRMVSLRPRLPSVANFLHPRPSIGSPPRAAPAYSGARSLPPSPTASRPSVASFDATRSLSTQWERPPQDRGLLAAQPTALDGDNAAFLPATALIRTRRRFSPRSRLRASKRLAGHSLPSWSRPVGLSLTSAVYAHALLPHDSDRFAPYTREPEPYPRYQRSEWTEGASSEQHRGLMGRGEAHTALDSARDEEKSSWYLREIDRRNILARIDSDEKQSALAKEFQVTRAAICNLNKHSEFIMTRACDDLMTKHPKRVKPCTEEDGGEELSRDENIGSSSSSTENRTGPTDRDESKTPTSQQLDQVYQVDSRAVAMLRVLMHDHNTSELAFRQHCARLMVCLIEEAVAWMYSRPHRLGGVSHEDDRHHPTASIEHFMLDEYYTRRPPCGIAVDEFGPLFLDKFRAIDPTWRSGAIEFPAASATASNGFPVRMDLPRALPACNVFLLLSFARGEGCKRLHQSVRILIDHGVVEELLCLVALSISSRAMSLLHAEFPRIRMTAASIEREADDAQGVDGLVKHEGDGLGSNVMRGDGQEERTPTKRLTKLAVSS